MKFVRYGPRGAERPGVLDAQGKLGDLSGPCGDLSGPALDVVELGIEGMGQQRQTVIADHAGA